MYKDFIALLDDMSECFINSDFDLWRSRVELPLSIITIDGTEDISSVAQLEKNFEKYLVARDVISLDQVYRVPVSLDKSDDDTWLGTYETHLLSRTRRVVDPYISTAMLVTRDDRFRIKAILGARNHDVRLGRNFRDAGQ